MWSPTTTSAAAAVAAAAAEERLPCPVSARGNDILEIKGPYNPTGISVSTTRPLIFVCDPKAIGEPACAKQITENLAHRAYRRPVTADDISRLMNFYNEGRLDNGTFDQGITEVVAAVLASPDFLYRSIQAPKTVSKNSEFPLTDLELASRLSFFIWNTGPDAELLKLAETNQLSKPGVVDAQVKRMMADPKAESLVTSFAMKWLNLNSLDSVQPDAKIFHGFNATLRKDFVTEAELFLGSILLENKNVTDLLTSDQTFVNNRLARHYGIDRAEHVGVQGGHPDGPEPLRPAGKGRGADEDFLCRPHLSGAARRVGARQDHRHAPDASSAKRRHQSGAKSRAKLRRRFAPGWKRTATSQPASNATA